MCYPRSIEVHQIKDEKGNTGIEIKLANADECTTYTFNAGEAWNFVEHIKAILKTPIAEETNRDKFIRIVSNEKTDTLDNAKRRIAARKR